MYKSSRKRPDYAKLHVIPNFYPNLSMFLAVTWQLYRFPCHWLTDSLTDRHFWKHYQRALWEWPLLRHVIRVLRRHNLTNFRNFSDCQKTFRFAENFQIFFEKNQIFGKFSETWHLKYWLHFWQLRTKMLTITL